MKIFAENIPIYVQLKTEMEDVILNGHLKAEDAIPSIRHLAAEYEINPLTVSRAVNELEAEGIIYKKRGIGFFVSNQAFEIIRRTRMDQYLASEVRVFVQKAIQLGMNPDEIQKLIKKTYQEFENGKHHGD